MTAVMKVETRHYQ